MNKEQWEALIGCTVHACEKHATWDLENTGELVQVKEGWLKIKYTEYNSGRWFETKDCKPVFSPADERRAWLDRADYILEEETK